MHKQTNQKQSFTTPRSLWQLWLVCSLTVGNVIKFMLLKALSSSVVYYTIQYFFIMKQNKRSD